MVLVENPLVAPRRRRLRAMQTHFRNRRAVHFESDALRVTVLLEGGHIAELLHKRTDVNPLWIPPWPSIEPSIYDPDEHPEYGRNSESKLLAGLMGHNLCLDTFGGPSDAEAAAGMTVHGEASVIPHQVAVADGVLTQTAVLLHAQLNFHRQIRFVSPTVLHFVEEVENLSSWDRP